MAGRATVHAVEFRQNDLADLYRYALGERPLLGRDGAANFFPDEFALKILPLTKLVLVVAADNQAADNQAQHREPWVKFGDRFVAHVSGSPSPPAVSSRVPATTSSDRGRSCR